MQRIKMRLSKKQQDPLLTPMTSLTDIKPNESIGPEYHDHSEYDQYLEHMIHEYDIQIEENDLIEKQRRAGALIARQLQEEE